MLRLLFVFSFACAACAPIRPRVSLPAGDPRQPHASFNPADDGPHPSAEPGYFEWWYYDATFEDGTSVTLALYSAQLFAGDRRPAVLVNLLDTSGKSRAAYHAFEPGTASFGQAGEVSVAGSSARRIGDRAVRVIASGRTAEGEALEVDLTFEGTMPGFKAGGGEVRLDGKVALGWVVPMPRARVEGSVRIAGVERRVRGHGYHDHNWGELNLLDTMGYWYWGRLTSDQATVVYANVNFREALGVPPLTMVVAGDAERFRAVEVSPEFIPVGETYLAGANRVVPRGLVIRSDTLGLRLASVKTLEAVDFTPSVSWYLRPFVRRVSHPAYVRQLCTYQLTTHVDGLPAASSGRGIAEYMYIYRR